ncbi:hypothetical protein G7L40_00395 [Paenibacillus polymyxa]|uniref:Uncharacterized protein n=2 Tax=Paenibacillus polymyxa TaxID=1406 RepID=A0A378XVH2_PAEPO|nr:hypothetical protein [Paenibacillus polymyxa]MBE7897169.1 hypothetical protein [Paenibacillus polymyxa]MBG9763026.1 hypothetical protein [Paenibacillus polymyxa]MCC3257582.1 hypothetical protein [Paenibacillus polymyxa]QPK51335.1 hypothetical protein G7035_00395 [Paenibacillus polymyxa]QPK56425.1 hypothetical protein G7L40_00395 [Paenibacillus polymyxa]
MNKSLTVDEMNKDYALYVASLSFEALSINEPHAHILTASYIKTPDDYLDDTIEWGEQPSKEATKEFLNQFYVPESTEKILNRYEWDGK